MVNPLIGGPSGHVSVLSPSGTVAGGFEVQKKLSSNQNPGYLSYIRDLTIYPVI